MSARSKHIHTHTHTRTGSHMQVATATVGQEGEGGVVKEGAAHICVVSVAETFRVYCA